MPNDEKSIRSRPHSKRGRDRLADEMNRLQRTPLSAIPGLAATYGCPNRKARRRAKQRAAVLEAQRATGPDVAVPETK